MDQHGATQHMAEPFLSSSDQELMFPAGFGMGWDVYACTGIVSPRDRGTQGTVSFVSRGPGWG